MEDTQEPGNAKVEESIIATSLKTLFILIINSDPKKTNAQV